MRLLAWVVVITVMFGVRFAVGAIEARQSRRWVSECFGTVDALVARLNQLPEAAADTAKLIPIPGQRNVGGWLGQPYCVAHK